MYLTKITKTPFLLIGLLYISSPTHLQTTQTTSSTKHTKILIPTIVLAFLNKQLNNLPSTTERTSLFETIEKLKNNSGTLKQEEKIKLSEYVTQETIQLDKELPCIKDNKKLKKMEQIHQTLTSFKEQISTLYNTSFTQPTNTQQPDTPRRPHELLIPANGNCLYTSIILGYLLPVLNSPSEFNQRLQNIVDSQSLPMTHNELISHYEDLEYLDSNIGFQQIISSLIKQIGIEPGTWGGPKEIGLIANKLNINIQEHTSDPDNPNQLIKGTLYKKNNRSPKATLHIVQDIPFPQELVNSYDEPELKQAQISSLQTSQHRHHYRLYYTGNLPEPLEEEEKNDDVSYTTDEELHELEVQESQLGTDNLDAAISYYSLGRRYENEGQYKEAAKCYIKSIVIQESKLEKYHRDTVKTYDPLELLYEEKGECKEASKYLKRTLQTRQIISGEYHLSIARSYHTLGLLYETQGNYHKAANTYYILSRLYKNHLNCKEAEKYYIKGLKIQEGKLDADDLDTVSFYHNSGRQCEKQGNYKEAAMYFKKALEIAEAKLGEDDHFTISCRNELKRVQSLL